MKHLNSKLFSFIMVTILSMMSLPVMAGNSDYYSKATAKAVGAGKVYVSYNNESNNPGYAETSEASSGKDSQRSAPTHTYYLYAQAEEGYKFDGWFTTETCEGSAESNNNPCKIEIEASTNVNNATKHYYAKFVEAAAPSLYCDVDRIYVNLGDEPKANEGVHYENFIPSFQSSNTNVATVAADGKVSAVGAGSAVITVSGEDITSVEYVVTVLDYSEAGKTQIGNGDFEDWSNVTNNNHAPKNWNSFETAEGNLASMAGGVQVQMVQNNRPGSNGLFCADIFAKDIKDPVLGIATVATAQGNLTLGCINATAATANAAGNHNFSKITDESKSETISKIPTALKCWVKFVPSKTNAQHPYARVAATVHDKYNYITYGSASHDTDSNKEHVVASAEQNFTACDWTELTLPFTLSGNAVLNDQLYIVVNFTTNAEPGQGQVDDHLFIDDVELVYENDFDEVPVKVGDAKWATFVAPFDVKMPAAISASTVETVGETYDTMLDTIHVENNLVPANTPVILNAAEAQDRIAYGVADPVAAPEYGLLVGTYENITAPVGSYVLQNHDGAVGFYKVEDAKPAVKANRAYLNVPGGTDARFLGFDGEETAIEAVEALTSGKAEIFDLSGRRLSSLQKGINIVNGKKILVK